MINNNYEIYFFILIIFKFHRVNKDIKKRHFQNWLSFYVYIYRLQSVMNKIEKFSYLTSYNGEYFEFNDLIVQ